MPPDRAHPPRQAPVSCNSCRKKKLKCDRSPRCSNCQARSIECSYQGNPPGNGLRLPPPVAPPTEDVDLRTENAAIKARLQRLEQAVFGNQSVSSAGLLSPRHPTTAGAGLTPTDTGLKSPETNSCPHSPEAEHVKAFSADTRWLESVGQSSYTDLPRLHGAPVFRCASLDEIVQATSTGTPPAYILLPVLKEARQLLRYYVEHLDCLQHIIHVPSVYAMFDAVWDALQAGQSPKSSHAALVLSVLASIAGWWGVGEAEAEAEDALGFPPAESLKASTYWLRGALDLLDHVWRTSLPDLETIQTSIVLVFLLYRLEGFSHKLRRLHSSAIAMARDIGLHSTDSPQCKRQEESRQQILEAEMRRRVWWHLASTDWSLALAGGPHEGTYSVQPRHMQVKRPRNVTDEDLLTQDATFTRPLDEPTSSSYYLQRIRLAEVCREAADVTWDLISVSSPDEIAYDQVLAVDRRFADLLDTLPNVLRLENERRPPEGTTESQLVKQRLFTYLTIHARRSKLHLPFLIRAERDARYVTSRTICLASARNVLTLKHILPGSDEQPQQRAANARNKLIRPMGILHHFFCALVVLVMDICVNKAAGNEEGRKLEVQDACRVFEIASERSAPAAKFLESLTTILKKHKVRLQAGPSAINYGGGGQNHQDATAVFPDGVAGSTWYEAPDVAAGGGVDGVEGLGFDDLWQTYFDLGTDIEPQSWDAIFSDLDMRIE